MGKCGCKMVFAISATMKMVFGDQQLVFANFITWFKVQGINAKSLCFFFSHFLKRWTKGFKNLELRTTWGNYCY